MTPARARGAVFELTVAGQIGPVLQAVLRPVAATTSCELHTVVCMRCHAGQDLGDILQLLDSRGLEAAMIRPID